MSIEEIFELLAEGIDPTTGEVFDKAQKSHSDSIDFIDKAIAMLTKARDTLTSSDDNILLAENRLNEINIMQLTKGNTTMKQKFLDAGVDLAN